MTVEEYNELKARSLCCNVELSFDEFDFREIKTGDVILKKWKSKDKICEIPDFITEISNNAFNDCVWLESIDFCNSGVKVIPSRLFYNLTNLKKVKLSNKIEMIESQAFYNTGIQEILFPDSLKEIGTEAFKNNRQLTNVCFGENSRIQKIKNESFMDTNIKLFHAPDSLERIYSKAFYHCHNLEEVYLGKGIIHISHEVFSYCNSLKKVEINKEAPLKSISKLLFFSCNSLEEVILNQNVDTVNEYALFGCKSLSKIIGIEDVKLLHYTALKGTPLE